MAEEKKQEEAKAEEKVEAKKQEEKKEEGKPEEKKVEEPPKPPSPFILRVDMHCVGCAKKIERSIMRIRGVEGVQIDMEKNEVTIRGVVEPQAVCNKITKKTKRRAQVISPLPPAEGEPLPQVVTSQVSGLATVELNVNMHCDACAGQLRSKILKMKGVQKVETDVSAETVKVTGTMDTQKLVDYIHRRTKKQAKIIPQPDPKQKPEEAAPGNNDDKKPVEGEAKPEDAKKEEGNGKGGETGKEDEKGKEGDKGKAEEGEKEVLEAEEEVKGAAVVYEDELGMKRMMHYYQPLYIIERLPPPPQIFSDENPNACCIS